MDSYYAVIFTSKRTDIEEGYGPMNIKLEQLGKGMPGFLGIESARQELGITISYWQTLEDISRWKAHTLHVIAQEKGQEKWYEWYTVRICKVEREYSFGSSGCFGPMVQGPN